MSFCETRTDSSTCKAKSIEWSWNNMLVKHKAYFMNIFVLLFLIPDPFVVSPYAYGFIFPVACKVAEVE